MATEHESDTPSPYPADTSLKATLDELAAAGYAASLAIVGDDGELACSSCTTTSPADTVRFEERRRIEGASDPGEMSNVLAARCPRCGEPGVVICRYGPEAGPGDSAVLQAARGQIPD